MVFPAQLNLSDLDGTNGFVINGIDESDRSGVSVSNGGDINGDGIDDLIIGAYYASPNGNNYAGESYVVFGDGDIGSGGTFELSSLDDENGFVLNGIDPGDRLGESVSNAGDVNGDTFNDLIIGADRADPNGNDDAGESYVVFGGDDIAPGGTFDLSSLDGSNGFVLNGIDLSDRSGISVSNAGDVNNDGADDLIIGADRADPNGNDEAGESYVIFGIANTAPDAMDDSFTTSEDISLTITAEDLLSNDSDPDEGDTLTISSIDTDGTTGTVTDNGDGTFTYNPNGQFDSLNTGESAIDSFSYTIDDGNGGTDTATVTITIDGVDEPVNLNGGNGKDTLNGTGGSDTLSGGNGKDELFGNGRNDLLDGGNGKDTLNGGQGDDTLIGGRGSDIFVLAPSEGTDRIEDFSNQDLIGLSGGISFNDLSFAGNDIILSSTQEVLATLTGVQTSELTSRDFTSL